MALAEVTVLPKISQVKPESITGFDNDAHWTSMHDYITW